jgi:hypothetical protein
VASAVAVFRSTAEAMEGLNRRAWRSSEALRWYGRFRLARYQRFEEHGEGHSVLLHQANDFGLLVYATSIAELRAQLTFAGYGEIDILGPASGRPVLKGRSEDQPYFHVIARKPAT